jgi:Protein of unknown function (DUF732)
MQLNGVGHNDRPRQGSETGPGPSISKGIFTMTKINMGAAVPMCAVALSVVGSLVLGAAPAHADTGTTQFISDVHAAGMSNDGGNTGILKAGYAVCGYLAAGISPTDIAGIIYSNSQQHQGDDGVTLTQARALVGAAAADLC